VTALGAPFVLEGLFGEAGAKAIDASPDSELAADAMGMDAESGAERRRRRTGGVIVDDDNDAHTVCVPPNLPPS
jgi:hypothetical protein